MIWDVAVDMQVETEVAGILETMSEPDVESQFVRRKTMEAMAATSNIHRRREFGMVVLAIAFRASDGLRSS